MNSKEWLNSLNETGAVSAVVPVGLQPAMPLPILHGEKLLIYVPFYHVKPEQDGIACTDKLIEFYFEAITKRPVMFCDLRMIMGYEPKITAYSELPTDSAIRRIALASDQLLSDLDDIVKRYSVDRFVSPESLKEYFSCLKDTLLIPDSIRMYEEIGL